MFGCTYIGGESNAVDIVFSRDTTQCNIVVASHGLLE